ncbi:MAG: hypothetical protein CM15mP122_5830 [Bacteroidota bacterium]|nr:MAG: hypothetical protein CM15mP122_5830 [Bacteroidota bacterium]
MKKDISKNIGFVNNIQKGKLKHLFSEEIIIRQNQKWKWGA